METNGLHAAIQGRLKQAEAAEALRERLASLAAEAPQLRSELAKLERQEERERTRDSAMMEAQKEVEAATNKQLLVPELLIAAARAAHDLYVVLREIDSHRREAMKFLAVVDRADYEAEVEEALEQQTNLGRDTRALAYVYASQHGERRVRQLLDEMCPGFSFFQGCDLDNPLRQDVADFVLEHAVQDELARMNGAGSLPPGATSLPSPDAAPEPYAPQEPVRSPSSPSGFIAEQTEEEQES